MKEIPLTKGYVALVDDDDYDWAAHFSWHASIAGYAVYARRKVMGLPGNIRVYLHRQLLGAVTGQIVDHIDHDTLNCVRSNLRITNKAGNSSNRPKMRKDTSSQYKGVTLEKNRLKWIAQITVNGKHSHLGYFLDEADAARAYDKAANDAFGEFAFLNFRKAS